jgi:acetoin utilization deacetylase AcuC-like enzyme
MPRHALPIFYDPRQNAFTPESASPSAHKPAEVVASWQRLGIPLEVRGFEPVLPEQLHEVHEAAYVDGIFAGTRPNGFYNTLPEVAESLRWTTGSFLAAARHVATGAPVAVSPTSGFHHAGWSGGGGYCTFNGLMLAARTLLDEKLADKVGILDLDMHYGDGTDAIILKLRLTGRVEHYTFGLSAVQHGPARDAAGTERWLTELPRIVESFHERGCQVLLYQAGADPHVDDPLGGVMTSDQMRRRDALVFSGCQRLGLPVAWNLAGGYQQPLRKVLDLHDATLMACAEAFGGSD